MKNKKVVIFDFNGTLIDDAKVVVRDFNEMCKEDGIEGTDIVEYRNNFSFPSINYYKLHNFDCSRFDILAARFQIKYENYWKEMAGLFDGVKECFDEFKKRGYMILCLSASRQWFLEYQLKELGIYDYFSAIQGLDNGLGQSKIEAGKNFIKGLNLNLDECVMIGDTIHDFEVAQAIGIDCVLSTQGHCTRERLSKCGVPMFDSFKELEEIIE